MFTSTILDDPLVFDACASFDGGVVSNRRANLLATNQLASLVNGDITRAGQIITRRGTRRLGSGAVAGGSALPIQGLNYYDAPTGGYLVAAAGGSLWRFDGNGNWAPLVSTVDGTLGPWRAVDASAPVSFAQGADCLFFTDGSGSIHGWNGKFYQDLGSVSADPNLRPPVGHLLAWHASRLCVAGVAAVPDAIYFSDPLLAAPAPGAPPWNHTDNRVRAGGGEGDEIVALVPWSDFNLVVLKRHGAWIVNAASASAAPSAFPVNAINNRIGCIAGRTATQVGTDVWFLSADGVRSVRRTTATTQQEVSDTLSYPIQDLIERINPAAVGTSCAACWGSRYLLAVPLDGASAPNAVLVCDTETRTWTGQWLGWRPADWAVSAYGGDPRLCFGQVNGTVSEWLDYVPASAETPETFTDAGGQPVATQLRTRSLTFGQAYCPKTGLNYEAEFNGSQADVTVQAILDDSAASATGDGFPTGGAARVLPLTLPLVLPRGGIVRRALDLQRFGPFRELQFDVASTSGKLALRSISASAFVDTLEVQS